jgi:hypothetical protein
MWFGAFGVVRVVCCVWFGACESLRIFLCGAVFIRYYCGVLNPGGKCQMTNVKFIFWPQGAKCQMTNEGTFDICHLTFFPGGKKNFDICHLTFAPGAKKTFVI